MGERWVADFCGCCNAPVPCCLTAYGGWLGLACVQCENKKEMDGDGALIAFALGFFLMCIGAAMNRQKVREKYNLSGNCVLDGFMYLCCECCMGTQEYREVQLRKQMATKQ